MAPLIKPVRFDDVLDYARRDLKFDASEAMVFARELMKVRAGLMEQKFPELIADQLIPRNTDMTPVDEEFTYQTVTEYGTTKLGASYSTDAPLANVSFDEAAPKRVRVFTSAYDYTFHEAAVSAQLGRNLPARKARAARRILAFKHDDILATGAAAADTGIKLDGLLTLDKESAPTDDNKVREYVAPNGDSGSNKWLDTDNVTPLKTPDEILRDMFGMEQKIHTDSNGVEIPNTMLLSQPHYNHVSTTRLGDGSDTTILRHFLAHSQWIKDVRRWHKLDSNSAWTGRRIVTYRKDPEVLEYLAPVIFRQQAPQRVRMRTIVDCDMRHGGVVVYRHKAICYADNL